MNDSHFIFHFNEDIKNKEDLYNCKKLLGDQTQSVLLPYIKKTEELLNKIVKHYDVREKSGAVIIPSLDLGYPNNVMRLAGGFATGMLIDWECGTPIVPIDATVNVCSSSVFKIKPTEEFLDNIQGEIKSATGYAGANLGYSFSFESGNHFLIIAKDNEGSYYLVMHSSAKELKESYFGLYPTEGNWYSSQIKTIYDGDRYIRYIKGKEAEHFILTAHHIEKYNEEIHRWLAYRLNGCVSISPDDSIIKHHYYMPTDSSIVIGTFAEPPGEKVPLFSDFKKPIYLFEIGEDNWTYNLGGSKGDICLVPHGWGQQIENVSGIQVSNGSLELKTLDGSISRYEVNSKQRFQDNIGKCIRKFKNGGAFLEQGKCFVKGKIIKTLNPVYIYCKGFNNYVEDKK